LTYRLATGTHPVLNGLPAEQQFTAVPFPPGSYWERYGNEVWPLIYVDAAAAPDATVPLGCWVLDGQTRRDLLALCVRTVESRRRGRWNSVYAAVPFLTPELLRNLARFAGVHIYRDTNDILFADRNFVAVHTGGAPASGALHLPTSAPVYDICGRQTLAASSRDVAIYVPPYSTALYYLGDPQPFRAAVEGNR
jgi:hypothetical protein